MNVKAAAFALISFLLTSPAVASAQSRIPPAFLGTWMHTDLLTQNLDLFPPGTPPAELPYRVLDKGLEEFVQPWALARRDATEWNIDDLGQVCKPTGIFRHGHGSGYGFRLVEAPGKLYQIFGGMAPHLQDERGLQRIYFDSPHPKNLLPTFNGDSRGRFEGDDTLVVDTIGFNDKTFLNSDRWPHTEELHVIQRYRLFAGGGYMQLRAFVDDRKTLKAPYTYTRYFRKVPDATEAKGPDVCNQDPPGENLFVVRRNELIAEHQAQLKALVAKYENESLPQAQTPVSASRPAVDARLRRLAGIYEPVSAETSVPGGRRRAGTLADLPLQPAALEASKSRNPTLDPAKHCRAIGPFRMMARDDTKFEVLTTENRVTLFFQRNALGNKREIYLSRIQHPADFEPNWNGDSIGRWDGDTLVVDTTGLNEMTWLNDAGAPHSDLLRVVERYRLIEGGRYLELQVTAEDPKVLTRPYTYTRYYQKVETELAEDFCEEETGN